MCKIYAHPQHTVAENETKNYRRGKKVTKTRIVADKLFGQNLHKIYVYAHKMVYLFLSRIAHLLLNA